MKKLCTAALLAALAAPAALALINPNFTPIHLVEQSERVLVLKLGPATAKGEIPVALGECLKGKKPEKAPTLDLSKTPKPQAEALARIVGNRQAPALLFSGQFRNEGPDAGGGEEPAEGTVGFLHVQGAWFRLFSREPGAWLVDVLDEHMQNCWAGGTDMLERAVRYVLTDPAPSLPCRTGASWGEIKKIATIEGKIHGVIPVDIMGDGAITLHILCESGDRLFTLRDQKALENAGGVRHSAKSRAAAWGDFDGDGRLDVASWDGETLSVWSQSGHAVKKLQADCLALGTLGLDGKGRAGIVVSTQSYPLLVTLDKGGALEADYLIPPVAGKFIGSDLGAARPCLIADFDGDAVPDLLQPFAKGSVFYKGMGLARFDGGTRIEGLGTGEGDAGAFVGDFDADGLLDIFVAADERCLLWHNRTGGNEAEDPSQSRTRTRTIEFEETLGLAGEAAYISKPCGIGGTTGDVNNDGRQDIFILYSNRAPHIFFNRGFRSFGHSHMLDTDERSLLDAARGGQQAGCLADLDGDGGQDMALVLQNGELWVLFRDTQDAPALCLRAALPLGGYAGPLTVTGWSDKRCLGAWNLVAGVSEAFFGQYEPGPMKLRWQFPGAKPQEKQIVVEEKPVRFLLKP